MGDTGIATIPRPVAPGEEMEALKRFHPDVTWQGASDSVIPMLVALAIVNLIGVYFYLRRNVEREHLDARKP